MATNYRLQLAHLAMLLGRPEEARIQYRRAIAMLRGGVVIQPSPQRDLTAFLTELAALVEEAGHHEDALQLFEIASLDSARYPDLQAAVHRDWATLLRRMGRDDDAAEHEAQAAELSAEDNP